MKHLFVPYELALKLKEKKCVFDALALYKDLSFPNKKRISFNTKKLVKYDYIGVKSNRIQNIFGLDFIAAPLYQQVVDWFREKYNINIVVAKNDELILNYVKTQSPDLDVNQYQYRWYLADQQSDNGSNGNVGSTSTYYSAFNNAIEHSLKLI